MTCAKNTVSTRLRCTHGCNPFTATRLKTTSSKNRACFRLANIKEKVAFESPVRGDRKTAGGGASEASATPGKAPPTIRTALAVAGKIADGTFLVQLATGNRASRKPVWQPFTVTEPYTLPTLLGKRAISKAHKHLACTKLNCSRNLPLFMLRSASGAALHATPAAHHAA